MAIRESEEQRELMYTLFRLRGPSGRSVRCGLYRVPLGLELLVEYEDHADTVISRLFHVDDGRIAAVAEQWRRVLLKSGFNELAANETN